MVFEIRNFESGDEEAICALFEKVFGKPLGRPDSLTAWRWKYLSNPVGQILIKLAWDGKRLVGHYAISPVRMHIDGKESLAGRAQDVMVDPDYQGLGIFTRLASATYEEMKEIGFVIVYGFPNRNTIYGYLNKLNWKKFMPVPVSVRPVVPRKLPDFGERRGAKKKGDNPAKIVEVLEAQFLTFGGFVFRKEDFFGEWVNDLWCRCKGYHRVWVIRDRLYLNWRYVEKPGNTYTIISVWSGHTCVGYVVFDVVNWKFGKILFILDFVVDLAFTNSAQALVKYILRLARDTGSVLVSSLISPRSRYWYMFKRRLFLPLPERLFPQPLHFGARILLHGFENVIFDPSTWYLGWGDNDVL